MKDLSLLVWLTQLGFSVAAPLAGFVLLAVWLRDRFSLGNWIVLVGLVFGICSAISGLRSCLKLLERQSRGKKKDDGPPPVAFNDHY